MNDLVSSGMKINDCSTSDNHKVSLFLKVENVVVDALHFMGPKA